MRFNKLFAFLVGVIVFNTTICTATVPEDKIAIGGIVPGMSVNDLITAFGEPNSNIGVDWHYKDFDVEIEHGIVEKVSTRNETIITPDSVRVGLSEDILNATFGQADRFERDYDDIEYKYYSDDHSKKIEFKVTNGIIVEISCEIKYESSPSQKNF